MEELPDDPYSVYTEPLKVNSLEAGIASRGKCPHEPRLSHTLEDMLKEDDKEWASEVSRKKRDAE